MENENDDKDAGAIALREFLLDIDCLEPLNEWASQFNIFDVLGIARMEVRHSNALGWLLDPNENHGLGDAVIRGFLNHVSIAGNEHVDVFDTLLLDCHDFTVQREWRNIDILAVSASEEYVVCIENKIGSGEHDDQLNRYREIIESQFPTYRHAFVYLSPEGNDASDPEHWCAMSYNDVLEIIETAKAKTRLLPDVELLVDNYIEIIRRNVVEDERLDQICAEIYAKHRKALDLIYEHKPDPTSLKATIRAWAEQRNAEGKIVWEKGNSSPTRTRFTTHRMSAALPDTEDANSSWGTRSHYFYEIHRIGSEGFESWFCLNRKGADSELAKRFESVLKYASSHPKKTNWTYHTMCHTSIFSVDEYMGEEEIFEQLDKQLEQLMEFEARVAPRVIEDAQSWIATALSAN